MQQVAHEEVETLVFAVLLTHGVVNARQHHELEVLAGLYQRVGYLVRA